MAQHTLLENAQAQGAGDWKKVPYRDDAYLEAEITGTATIDIEHRAREGAAVQQLHQFAETGNHVLEALPAGEVRANVSAYTDGEASASIQYPGGSGAVNGSGFDTVNATVKEKPAPPSNASATDVANPVVSWDASPDPGGSKVAKYNLYRDGAFMDSVRWGVTEYTDDGSGDLAAPALNTTYTYEIRAESPEGKESDGITAQATTPAAYS